MTSEQWPLQWHREASKRENLDKIVERGVLIMFSMWCTCAWDSTLLEHKDLVSFYWCHVRESVLSCKCSVRASLEIIQVVALEFCVSIDICEHFQWNEWMLVRWHNAWKQRFSELLLPLGLLSFMCSIWCTDAWDSMMLKKKNEWAITDVRGVPPLFPAFFVGLDTRRVR